MRKADEITLLDTLIQQTPRNSYLRTMLEYLTVQFESDIRSDFTTVPDIAALEREGQKLRERNNELQVLNRGVEKQIREQREYQAALYARIRSLKDDVMRAGAALETALNNFSKE